MKDRGLNAWLPFAAVVALATFLSAVAYANRLPAFMHTIANVDKLVHVLLSALLGSTLDIARKRGRAVLTAAFVLVPVGVEEYLQRFATYRTSSIWDFAADVAGVTAGIALSRALASGRKA